MVTIRKSVTAGNKFTYVMSGDIFLGYGAITRYADHESIRLALTQRWRTSAMRQR